jgi:flagellar motility protein MotE (MotC chaperone)
MAALAVLLAVKSAVILRAALPGGHAPGAFAAAAVVPAALAAPQAEAKPVAPPKAPETQGGPPSGPPPEPPVSDAERTLLLDLRQRRQVLETREAMLATREEVVGAAERRLADRVTELQALQTRLEALETTRRGHDEANWRGLVKLYESMKPRDAATIMNELDLPVLLEVVDRMKEAKAAPILAAMQPDRARQVTAELARQRTRANTPEGG